MIRLLRRLSPVLALIGLLGVATPASADDSPPADAPAPVIEPHRQGGFAPPTPPQDSAHGGPLLGRDESPRVPGGADLHEPRPQRPGTVGLEGGVRMNVVPNAGLDPYATDDVLPQLSVAASLVAVRAGSLSLALRGGWDVGGASAFTRGDAMSLVVHRMSAGVEARYALAPWLHLVADVAPAALHMRGSIEDGGFDRRLVARSWTWGIDASGGIALRMARFGKPEVRGGLWFLAEAGYGFAGEAEMVFTPDAEPDDTRRFGDTVLPPLRPAGAMNRFALALTF